MSKILIIPDVHGRTFWKKAYDYINDVDEIIFLGDYLDPYDFEKISEQQSIDNFKEILEFKQSCSKVTLLLGNHDLHYFPPLTEYWGCRRIDSQLKELSELYLKHINDFKVVRIIDDYLFSHAGILLEWYETITDKRPYSGATFYSQIRLGHKLNIDFSEEGFNSLIHDEFGLLALNMVSSERGGRDPFGSCMWADVHEHLYMFNPSTYYQIFSHSLYYPSLNDYYHDKHFAMLDCKKCFILNTETKELNEIR